MTATLPARPARSALDEVQGDYRIAIYLRISNDRDGKQLGVRRQLSFCQQVAGRYSHAHTPHIYRDNDRGASRFSTKPRPDFERLCANVKDGQYDIVIAYDTKRLTRRPAEHLQLVELAISTGVQYMFSKSPSFDLNTADGRRMAGYLAMDDAGEAEKNSERVRPEIEQRRMSGGEHGGHRKFGWPCPCPGDRVKIIENLDGEDEERRHVHVPLSQIETERKIVRDLTKRIIALGSEANVLRSFSAELRAAGVPTVNGGQWAARTVKGILMRPRNAGVVEYHGQPLRGGDGNYVMGTWDAIVSVEEWEAVCAILGAPSRGVWYGRAPKHLLSGIALCHCGTKVQGGAHGKYVSRCGHIKRDRAPIDAYVTDCLLDLLDKSGVMASVPARSNTPDLASQISAKLATLTEIEVALVTGDPMPAPWNVSRNGLQVAAQRLRDQIAELERERALRVVPPVLTGVSRNTWDALPIERQRHVLSTLLAVRLLPNTSRAKGFRPELVEVAQNPASLAPGALPS